MMEDWMLNLMLTLVVFVIYHVIIRKGDRETIEEEKLMAKKEIQDFQVSCDRKLIARWNGLSLVWDNKIEVIEVRLNEAKKLEKTLDQKIEQVRKTIEMIGGFEKRCEKAVTYVRENANPLLQKMAEIDQKVSMQKESKKAERRARFS